MLIALKLALVIALACTAELGDIQQASHVTGFSVCRPSISYHTDGFHNHLPGSFRRLRAAYDQNSYYSKHAVIHEGKHTTDHRLWLCHTLCWQHALVSAS